MSESLIIGIIGIFASVFFFFLGIIYGKKISKDQIKLIIDALNMDRLLDGKDKNQERLIFENNQIAGETTESLTFKIKASKIDIQNKRKIRINKIQAKLFKMFSSSVKRNFSHLQNDAAKDYTDFSSHFWHSHICIP